MTMDYSPWVEDYYYYLLLQLFMRINDGVYRLMKEKGKNKQSETELDQLIETYKVLILIIAIIL